MMEIEGCIKALERKDIDMPGKRVSYRSNYINTYLWQALSIITGFLSLFVVVPSLSTNKVIYGVYSLCTSLTVFFSYADLGFLNSARKYGAEFFIQGRTHDEMKVIGFVTYLMLLVFAALALVLGVFAVSPTILMPELEKGAVEYGVATQLLMILAFSSIIILCQRILSVIYSIRVEEYKIQRLFIFGNLIKIASIFFFFTGGRYMIVGYYLFFQLVNLIVVFIALLGIRKYNYKVKEFISFIRFDRSIFKRTIDLSVASLISMLAMILYYELDQIAISHLLGVGTVAIYGIALTVLNLVRSYSSLVYSPYTARFNHFVGLGDEEGLQRFVSKQIVVLTPILFFPVLVLALLAEPFVLSWVGTGYQESVTLVAIMVFCFVPGVLTNPISSYLYAKERSRELNIISIAHPLLYWTVIFIAYSFIGINSFAISKVVAPTITAIAYLVIYKSLFVQTGLNVVNITDAIIHITIPSAVCVACCLFARQFMFYEKSTLGLILNVVVMFICIIPTMAACIAANKELRTTVVDYMNVVFKKKQ